VVLGRLQLYGPDRAGATKSHIHLAARASRGNNKITVDSDVDWQAGEVVLVGSTEFDWQQAESMTIESISGRTVTFTATFDYDHHGAPAAEVSQPILIGILS
jgi:hypothetical protein